MYPITTSHLISPNDFLLGRHFKHVETSKRPELVIHRFDKTYDAFLTSGTHINVEMECQCNFNAIKFAFIER